MHVADHVRVLDLAARGTESVKGRFTRVYLGAMANIKVCIYNVREEF